MEEFYLPSNGAGRIHCALWTPETAPRAVVQIIHGIAEHIGRYDHFANFLTERGFAVCADDHMGHGLSVEAGGTYGYFSGGWMAAVKDERTLFEEMKRRYPEKTFIPAPPDDEACGCNNCRYMKMITLENIFTTLRDEQPEISLDEEVRRRAERSILNMIAIK